jgi:hypothetical protein
MCTERIAGRRDAFDLLDQARDVVGVEPDGASEMDCAQLAALDEPLHCSWMNVEKVGRLVRRQKSCVVGGASGDDVALSWCAATAASDAFSRFVGASRSLSRRALWSLARLVLRRLADLEEGELTCVEPHSSLVTYQSRAAASTRR